MTPEHTRPELEERVRQAQKRRDNARDRFDQLTAIIPAGQLTKEVIDSASAEYRSSIDELTKAVKVLRNFAGKKPA